MKRITRREFVASTVAASALAASRGSLAAQPQVFDRLRAEYLRWEAQMLKRRPVRAAG